MKAKRHSTSLIVTPLTPKIPSQHQRSQSTRNLVVSSTKAYPIIWTGGHFSPSGIGWILGALACFWHSSMSLHSHEAGGRNSDWVIGARIGSEN
jgi:hypothetical protein